MQSKLSLTLAALLLVPMLASRAEQVLTVAVFDFESKDEAVRDLGPKVATLINAHLSVEPTVVTVERAELEKVLGEQELGMSGTVQPETAAKVGHLTGANVLVTGRAFLIDRQLMLVAKIIGTETSRVYGEMATGAGVSSAADAAKELAGKIAKTVAAKADTLVAKAETREDRVEKIRKGFKEGKLPVVNVIVNERHFGGPAIDPAVETELALILQKCGFTVLSKDSVEKPDILITGEGFSEAGMRKGNLVACKARVELKMVEKATGKLLAVDRQTSVAVDLSEQIAGKTALQTAAQELAERILPKAVK